MESRQVPVRAAPGSREHRVFECAPGFQAAESGPGHLYRTDKSVIARPDLLQGHRGRRAASAEGGGASAVPPEAHRARTQTRRREDDERPLRRQTGPIASRNNS